ncbi:urate hydroxylase PuuD [Comamonas granuli]|uniref:urate hydroxylase PuuD n=1 Tax=Comamonas granuli TaxID=290309 RepID=UPI0005A9F614|nr:urate hydroxylase PuuD [Comamonas granuli]
MESYLLDWSNLLLRWLHVITAIAWIGSSFYFVFLDSSLTPPEDEDLKRQGVNGELWAVHGGGFYHPVKFNVSPPKLPGHLHWFYWESYSTWLSGFSLFTVSYLWSASTYLIDKSKMDWAPAIAIAAALGFLVVFWLLYDAVCRVFGQRKNGDAIVGALVFVLVCLASWLACHWFAGRAAFLLVGAMMATAMSANVFFWIIPGQRTVVAQIKAGQPVDPIHGKRGKQRSVHNTYFTLPVLFAMLSGHYSFTWSHPQNWLVLILMMFAGAAIRQFFVMRHGYKLGRNAHPWPYALAGVLVLVGTIAWLRPAPVQASTAPVSGAAGAASAGAGAGFDYQTVAAVLQQRCVQCHGAEVQMKNVRLDSAAQVGPRAQLIYQQVVQQKLMPMNNATQMTEDERALIARWYQAGAPVQ